MRSTPRSLVALAALSCGLSGGCAPAGSGKMPDLIPVTGKVLYKGQPLTQGSIKFDPEDGYGREANGKIKPDGTFTVTTFKEGDGVVAGHHRVAVTGTGIKSPRDMFAKKYGGVASSGLTADVDAEHHDFTFELK